MNSEDISNVMNAVISAFSLITDFHQEFIYWVRSFIIAFLKKTNLLNLVWLNNKVCHIKGTL